MQLTLPFRLWLNRWRVFRATLAGVRLGPEVQLAAGVRFHRTFARRSRGEIRLGRACRVEDGVVLETFGGVIELGAHVFLGPQVVIYGQGGVSIGDESLVSMHCRILSSNHAVPAFGTPIRSQPDQLRPTKIGRDVWLGAGVTVLGGVTIGDGCIIGAGSVVTKSLPPGTIAYGTPAVAKGVRDDSPPA